MGLRLVSPFGQISRLLRAAFAVIALLAVLGAAAAPVHASLLHSADASSPGLVSEDLPDGPAAAMDPADGGPGHTHDPSRADHMHDALMPAHLPPHPLLVTEAPLRSGAGPTVAGAGLPEVDRPPRS